MNLDRDLFRRELAGWAVRGVICAAPSAFWAVISDFHHPVEIAAMILVTALYIAGFAGFSAWSTMDATPSRRQFVRALKMAAWIKPVTGLGLGVACAVFTDGGVFRSGWLCSTVPDLFLGLESLDGVGRLAGVQGTDLGRLNSFAWTALATLVQGGLIAVLLAALSTAVLGWWWICAWFRPRLKISPVQIPG